MNFRTKTGKLLTLSLTSAIALVAGVQESQSYSTNPISFGSKIVDAANAGDSRTVSALIASGDNPDERGDLGTTALMRAAHQGNPELVRILLGNGANPDIADVGGGTALHIAARSGNAAIVRLLIAAGANINIADNEGNTALMKASATSRNEIVNLLLQAGASTEARNDLGETILSQLAPSHAPAPAEITAKRNEGIEGFYVPAKNENTASNQHAASSFAASAVPDFMLTDDDDDALPTRTSEQILADLKETKMIRAENSYSSDTPRKDWFNDIRTKIREEGNLEHASFSGGYEEGKQYTLLDLGSFKDKVFAERKIAELQRNHGSILSETSLQIVQKGTGANAAYHVNAGILPTKEKAIELCKQLISAGVGCRPVETTMMTQSQFNEFASDSLRQETAPQAPAPVDALPEPVNNAAEAARTALSNSAKEASSAVSDTANNSGAALQPAIAPAATIASTAPEKEDEDSFFDSAYNSLFGESKPEPKVTQQTAPKPEIIDAKTITGEIIKDRNDSLGGAAPAEVAKREITPVTSTVPAASFAAAPIVPVTPKEPVQISRHENVTEVSEQTSELGTVKTTTTTSLPAPFIAQMDKLEQERAEAANKANLARESAKEEIVVINQTDTSAQPARLEDLRRAAEPKNEIKSIIPETPSSIPLAAAPEPVKPVVPVITKTATPAPAQKLASSVREETIVETIVSNPNERAAPFTALSAPSEAPQATQQLAASPKPAPFTFSQTEAEKQREAELRDKINNRLASYEAEQRAAAAPVTVAQATNGQATPQQAPQQIIVRSATDRPAPQENPAGDINNAPLQPLPPATPRTQAQAQALVQQIEPIRPTQHVAAAEPSATVQQPAPGQPTQIVVQKENLLVKPSKVVVTKENETIAPIRQASAPQPVLTENPTTSLAPFTSESVPPIGPSYYITSKGSTALNSGSSVARINNNYSAPVYDKPNLLAKEIWVKVPGFSDPSSAKAFWNSISAGIPGMTDRYRVRTTRPVGNNANLYSAEIGPSYSKNAADNLCGLVTARGFKCTINTSLSSDKIRAASLNRATRTERVTRGGSQARHSSLIQDVNFHLRGSNY